MGRPSSTERLVCVVLAVVAVLSPLYIDRRPVVVVVDSDDEEDGVVAALWLPALLIVLILAINVTCFMDRRVVSDLAREYPVIRIRDRGADANPFDKYVKKKKLEPLETYVPAVLLTQDQFRDLEKSLEFEKPRYDESRSLLRSGPASSLRINIRAVAQYASSSGQGKAASDAVDECLRALEDLDSLLLQASRNNPSASVDVMRRKISVALGALDNLLQTVPSAVLDKGKAIADAYRTPADDYEMGNATELDPRLKQLQDIL
uniref:DUF7880 domain-containing protein n=1 Tax=Oryza brachyantha TaxID=4533 RepID=J3LKJ8_ORYBR